MSLCLLPTAGMFPRLRFRDDFFDEFNQIERVLLPLQNIAGGELSGFSDKITDDESKLSISVEVPQYKPEELKVSLDGRTLMIEGKQEIKEDGVYSMRCFARRWELPEEVDVEQIRSSLTEDGRLAIDVPKLPSQPANRSIPIQRKQ